MFLWVLVVPIRSLPTRIPVPKIRKTLIMFEPMIFAKARPGSRLTKANKEITNSGRDVPRETTVSPTIKGDILKKADIFSASLMKICVDRRSNKTPWTSNRAEINISFVKYLLVYLIFHKEVKNFQVC